MVNWQAPTAGSAPLANHVNQLLVAHQSQILYTGAVQSSQTTAGSGNTSNTNTWLAQSFTTTGAQTTVGYATMQLEDTVGDGSLLPAISVSLYTNSAGAPGTPIVSATITSEYAFKAPLNMFVPLPASGLTPSTTYWLVAQSSTVATGHFFWNKSNQVSGASTSPNGTTWTAQAFGFLYQVFDATAVGSRTFTWEDGGLRWTWHKYNANGTVATLAEYTAGQTSTGYLQSFRNMTNSNGLLATVS